MDVTGDRRNRSTGAALVAPPLFVATFTVDGLFRTGYHPTVRFVSELSIGSGGWVQRLNFVVTGVLIMYFTVGLRRTLAASAGRTLNSVTLGVLGLCLAASGPFVTDPSAPVTRATVHGTVHGVLGAIVFVCMPISAFSAASVRRRTGVEGRVWLRWSRLVGAALILLTLLLKLAELSTGSLWDWKGLIQRVILIGFFLWLFSFALLLWNGRDDGGSFSPPHRY